MTSVWELLLYIPITLVILAVLEACRHDNPRKVLRKTAVNFGALTAVLVLGSIVIFFINKYF